MEVDIGRAGAVNAIDVGPGAFGLAVIAGGSGNDIAAADGHSHAEHVSGLAFVGSFDRRQPAIGGESRGAYPVGVDALEDEGSALVGAVASSVGVGAVQAVPQWRADDDLAAVHRNRVAKGLAGFGVAGQQRLHQRPAGGAVLVHQHLAPALGQGLTGSEVVAVHAHGAAEVGAAAAVDAQRLAPAAAAELEDIGGVVVDVVDEASAQGGRCHVAGALRVQVGIDAGCTDDDGAAADVDSAAEGVARCDVAGRELVDLAPVAIDAFEDVSRTGVGATGAVPGRTDHDAVTADAHRVAEALARAVLVTRVELGRLDPGRAVPVVDVDDAIVRAIKLPADDQGVAVDRHGIGLHLQVVAEVGGDRRAQVQRLQRVVDDELGLLRPADRTVDGDELQAQVGQTQFIDGHRFDGQVGRHVGRDDLEVGQAVHDHRLDAREVELVATQRERAGPRDAGVGPVFAARGLAVAGNPHLVAQGAIDVAVEFDAQAAGCHTPFEVGEQRVVAALAVEDGPVAVQVDGVLDVEDVTAAATVDDHRVAVGVVGQLHEVVAAAQRDTHFLGQAGVDVQRRLAQQSAAVNGQTRHQAGVQEAHIPAARCGAGRHLGHQVDGRARGVEPRLQRRCRDVVGDAAHVQLAAGGKRDRQLVAAAGGVGGHGVAAGVGRAHRRDRGRSSARQHDGGEGLRLRVFVEDLLEQSDVDVGCADGVAGQAGGVQSLEVALGEAQICVGVVRVVQELHRVGAALAVDDDGNAFGAVEGGRQQVDGKAVEREQAAAVGRTEHDEVITRATIDGEARRLAASHLLLAVGAVQVDGVAAAAGVERYDLDAAVQHVGRTLARQGGGVHRPLVAVGQRSAAGDGVADGVGLTGAAVLVVEEEAVAEAVVLAFDAEAALDAGQRAAVLAFGHSADVDGVGLGAGRQRHRHAGVGGRDVETVLAKAQADVHRGSVFEGDTAQRHAQAVQGVALVTAGVDEGVLRIVGHEGVAAALAVQLQRAIDEVELAHVLRLQAGGRGADGEGVVTAAAKDAGLAIVVDAVDAEGVRAASQSHVDELDIAGKAASAVVDGARGVVDGPGVLVAQVAVVAGVETVVCAEQGVLAHAQASDADGAELVGVDGRVRIDRRGGVAAHLQRVVVAGATVVGHDAADARQRVAVVVDVQRVVTALAEDLGHELRAEALDLEAVARLAQPDHEEAGAGVWDAHVDAARHAQAVQAGDASVVGDVAADGRGAAAAAGVDDVARAAAAAGAGFHRHRGLYGVQRAGEEVEDVDQVVVEIARAHEQRLRCRARQVVTVGSAAALQRERVLRALHEEPVVRRIAHQPRRATGVDAGRAEQLQVVDVGAADDLHCGRLQVAFDGDGGADVEVALVAGHAGVVAAHGDGCAGLDQGTHGHLDVVTGVDQYRAVQRLDQPPGDCRTRERAAIAG